jgi:hypothetical protein
LQSVSTCVSRTRRTSWNGSLPRTSGPPAMSNAGCARALSLLP